MKNSIFQSKLFFIISGTLSLVLLYLIFSTIKEGFLFPSLKSLFIGIVNLIVQQNILLLYFQTIAKLLLCITISFFFALFIAFLRLFNKNCNYFFTPFLVFLKCSPLVILSVYIFFLWDNNIGPYIICMMVILPIICEGIFTSQEEINKQILSELSITNVSKIRKFIKIYIPMMTPYLTMLFLMCFGLGLKVIVMGEYLMVTPNSLGEFIYISKSYVDINSLLSILILCCVFTLFFEVIAAISQKNIKKYIYC